MTSATAPSDQALTSTHYKWGVLTDLHLAGNRARATHWHNTVMRNESRTLLSTALAHMVEQKVERLLLLGDLADEATGPDYDHLLAELGASGLRAWLIPGNHDRPRDGRTEYDDALADQAGLQLPAQGAQLDRAIVITGDLRANPADDEDYELGLDVPPGRDDTLLVVLTHFPVLDLSATLRHADLENAGDLRNRAEVADAVAEWQGPVLVLHGHQHIRTHAIADNILQLGFAALAEQPHDLATLELTLEHHGPHRGLGIDVLRQCRSLSAPPDGWRRSLLDPGQTRFTWTPDGWQPIPEQQGK